MSTGRWTKEIEAKAGRWIPDPTALSEETRLALRRLIALRARPALERWSVADIEAASYEVAREIMRDFQP